MPIEFCFVPQGEEVDFEVDNELLESGQGVLIENFASGEREIIAIGCFEYDGGGEVRFLPGLTGDFEFQSTIEPEDLPEASGVVAIGPGASTEVDYDSGDGVSGIIRVRHVGGGAITSSGLTPYSLIHHN